MTQYDWNDFGLKIPEIMIPREGTDYFRWAVVYVLSALFGLKGLFAAMPMAELLGVGLSIYFVLKKGKKYGVI